MTQTAKLLVEDSNSVITDEASDRRHIAAKFIASLRGRIILGQALVIAIEKLETVNGMHREISNISDMKLILKDFAIDLREDPQEL